MSVIASFKRDIKNIFIDYVDNCSNVNMEISSKLMKLLRYHRIEMILLDRPSFTFESNDDKDYIVCKSKDILRQNMRFLNVVKSLNMNFNKKAIDYVLLKECSMMSTYYKKKNHRYFADISFLINEKDIEIVKSILHEDGYIQGEIINGKVVRASKREILFLRLQTHEIHPMVKIDNGNLEINLDINFKFSWVGFGISGDSLVTFEKIKENTRYVNVLGVYVPMLNDVFQFIHLSCNIYNESVFFALHKTGCDPHELLLSRVLDVFLIINTKPDIEKIYTYSKRMNCIFKIEYVLSLIKIIVGVSYLHEFLKFFNIPCEFPNHFFLRNRKQIEWPITVYQRLFDIESKKEALRDLRERGYLEEFRI